MSHILQKHFYKIQKMFKSDGKKMKESKLPRGVRFVIWDNDGTIKGSVDPDDESAGAKIILPNVRETMESVQQAGGINIVCSGCKTPESECKNFDPKIIIPKMQTLMEDLPITATFFSPAIGGTQCWCVLRKKDEFETRRFHENPEYKDLIGCFKKPDAGMLIVIQDMLRQEFDVNPAGQIVMIGDMDADRLAAEAVSIPFVHADVIHGKVSPNPQKSQGICPLL
jgi:hypothetical protein